MKASKQKTIVLFEVLLILLLLAASAIIIIKPGYLRRGNTDFTTPAPTPEVIQSTLATSKPLPIQSPTPSPSVPEPITASLVSVGDCVPHSTLQKSGRINGEDKYDYTSIFEAVKPYAESADYSIISFESAATNNRRDYTNYPSFNCPPEMFNAFKYAGFDLMNFSNNHQLDRKIKGMFETRDNALKTGLEVIGAYDGEDPRYIIKDLNGIKVGIMSYTYGCNLNENALTPEQKARHLALIDEARMKKEITELEDKADITVIAMHWGNEYAKKQSEYQKNLGQKMLSWGADVILGSHPHVIQPCEVYEIDGETKYIMYSMGNFLSNQYASWYDKPGAHKEFREDGVLIKMEFKKDPATEKTIISSINHLPTWVWRYTENGIEKFKIIPLPSEDFYKNGEYSQEILKLANESYNRTIVMVKDYEQP